MVIGCFSEVQAQSDGDEEEQTKAVFDRKQDEVNGFQRTCFERLYWWFIFLTDASKMSHSQSMPEDAKMLNPSINAFVPSEKKVKPQNKDSMVPRLHGRAYSQFGENLSGQTITSSLLYSSQPSKPVSRFKMQRKLSLSKGVAQSTHLLNSTTPIPLNCARRPSTVDNVFVAMGIQDT
ncbi:hypothetical protein QQP08_008658 [Theobroma cacao]|nr:hypothetical protein QQP08_008658 [Theobroma cacao]